MKTSVFKSIINDGLAHTNTNSISPHQWQVIHHLQTCRTAALGTYHWHCEHCNKDTYWHCSCRDRHCPICQGEARQQWLKQRQADILPVTYHHLVFTLPHQFNGWATVHPEVIYNALFKIAWQTLTEFATARHRLDGQLGMMAVLHTWGQTLNQHVHLHCLIPGGVLTDKHEWCGTRKEGYLLPVKAVSTKYKGKMLAYLKLQAQEGNLSRINNDQVDSLLIQASQRSWVVYLKPAIDTNAAVSYLARYCNRVGISESRLSLTETNEVKLNYKNYQTSQHCVMHCSTSELLRRFILHILPKGLMRLRYYGFMANCVRKKSLDWIRESVSVLPMNLVNKIEVTTDKLVPQKLKCPECHHTSMIALGMINANGMYLAFRKRQ
jgi:hypothetical protein